MEDVEEFDLLIIILKKLCEKGCQKGSKDSTWILCARFTWGILTSLLTLVIAIKGKCDFFTEATVDKTSALQFLDKETLTDINICDNGSKFHDTSDPFKMLTENFVEKDSDHAPINITATLDGDVPFIFFTIIAYFAAFMFLFMFIGIIIIMCGGKIGSTLIGGLRYPYKAMAISISLFIIIYAFITFDKVDQNAASIISLVLSILSICFAIVMIIRCIYKKHCKKKKDSEPD